MPKQGLGLNDDITRNPFVGFDSGLLLDDAAEIFRRQTKLLGVVLHLATVSKMLDDGVEETVEQLLGGIELNPWRLTLGVGILFPKKYLHRVSLVANLLPLYISYPIHEIGIEIGF